ncbi:MAG TPA: bifunctional 4-hydroxy-3-methylbut-2-enyl diphosphate reductase/30S ribosomal protein S1, partial [Thermoanaerobacterales bacterium]|nr:bifunctional 4-hydroxy-3-methylbut-2-enyl diphosphate reductase/30S ribosomal protein S1 [Thermoanaerobacterales bacterium]
KKTIYILGDLIHNPQVVKLFEEKGAKKVNDINDIKEKNATIIIRSHGIPLKTYLKITEKGHKIIDATCPYVKKAQAKGKQLSKEGSNVIILGNPHHPEVKGINSYCGDNAIIIRNLDELKESNAINKHHNMGILAQTTANKDDWNSIIKYIKKTNPNIKIFNTICSATSRRQKAARELASSVDLMIVIGGYNSSNTNKLKEICEQRCSKTYHIESAVELNLEWFKNIKKVGITAGASTPDWIIKEVINKMKEISETEVKENEALQGENQKQQEQDKKVNLQEKYEETIKTLRVGDIAKGTVVQVSDNEVMVNVGYKSDGIIPLHELSNKDVSPDELVKNGDEIDVYVLKVEDKDGDLILSKKRADIIKAWEKIEELFETQEIIEAKVTEEVKGGLLVSIEGLRGFIPASHVDLQYVPKLSVFIGENFRLKIIEVDRTKNRIILSRKTILEEEYEQKRAETWETIKEGQIIKGKVQRLTDFGVFVDIGGVDGLVHISELSWGRVNHPSEVVKEGEEIDVKVLNVDKERNRISLGIKQTFPNPWESVEDRYTVGSIITGKVVKLVDFGAFVEVEPGIEGLVHISQISWEHVVKPDDVLSTGQEVKIKIMELNPQEHRMSLSIKEAEGAKEEEESIVEDQNDNITIGDMFKDILEEKKRKIDDLDND